MATTFQTTIQTNFPEKNIVISIKISFVPNSLINKKMRIGWDNSFVPIKRQAIISAMIA